MEATTKPPVAPLPPAAARPAPLTPEAGPTPAAPVAPPGLAHSPLAQPSRVADDAGLRQAVELLFFAYRDFTRDADTLLVRWGFGRAHHRVIYFVGRNPGMTVGELLSILRITKQSLAGVLGQLMREGFVVQRTDPGDRRRRRLYLTPEAEELERTLTARQTARIALAWAEAGNAAAEGFLAVLRAMIDPDAPGADPRSRNPAG